MRTVVPVPRGGHLPFVGSPALPPLRLTGGFRHADYTVPRQDVNSSFPPPPCGATLALGVCTHAGSGPSRVRRCLLKTCLGDSIPLAVFLCQFIHCDALLLGRANFELRIRIYWISLETIVNSTKILFDTSLPRVVGHKNALSVLQFLPCRAPWGLSFVTT